MMTGLVLEGGGMRGLFTAGVLDCLLDQKIFIPYCIGVSAGACNMTGYYSGQRKRSCRVNTEFVNDKRYMSWENFIRTGSLFSEEMMFHTIPEKLLPFDYDAYEKSGCQCYAVAASCLTGKPVYLPVTDLRHDYQPVLASMSLPLISKVVRYKGDELLDGGICDPIPAKRALKDCDRLVIVLTRQDGFVKKPESTLKLSRILYRHYPKLIRVLEQRHEIYNGQLAFVRQLEEEGRAVVIRPAAPVAIGRTEKDVAKLEALYEEGYKQAMEKIDSVRAFAQMR